MFQGMGFSFTPVLVSKGRDTLKGDYQLFISSMTFGNENISSL